MKKKNILITGAAGFIGSCLVSYLNSKGISNLTLVDNLGESEKWKNLVGKQFNDILHKDDLFTWLKDQKIEAIFHLGACSSTVETNCNYLLENNYRYTVKLADYAIPRGIRFIYASSAATYGDGASGFSDAHESLGNYSPLNMYGYSKHLFDLWLAKRNLLNRVVGLKYFNVFGPNEFHKGRMQSAPLKMVPEVMTTSKIRLFKSNDSRFTDGNQVRDFIYVKDVVQMTAAFLDNQSSGIFNVGTGKPSTWNQLAHGVIKALERKVPIEYIDMPKDLIGKYQNFTLADMTKWEKAKLPMPQFTLDEAVSDYVQNYVVPTKYW